MPTLLFRGEGKASYMPGMLKAKARLGPALGQPCKPADFLGGVKMSEASFTSEVYSVPGSRAELQVFNFKKLLK